GGAGGEGRPDAGVAIAVAQTAHFEIGDRGEVDELAVAPAEAGRIHRHVERPEGKRLAGRAQLDLESFRRMEPLGDGTVVEVARETEPRVEGVRGLAVGKEERPGVDRGREVARASAAVAGVIERELGEREQRILVAASGDELLV